MVKVLDEAQEEKKLSSTTPVVMDKYGGIEIDVPYDKTRRPEKQFASIFFEPKAKAVKSALPVKKNPSPLVETTEKRKNLEEHASGKKIKIVIRYKRPKLKDDKTAMLPAPSPHVRQTLYNLRILSGLLRELPRTPPTPPSSRLNSECSTSSGISSNSGSRVVSSQPPPQRSYPTLPPPPPPLQQQPKPQEQELPIQATATAVTTATTTTAAASNSNSHNTVASSAATKRQMPHIKKQYLQPPFQSIYLRPLVVV